MLHSDTFYAFLITAISLTIVATLLSRAQVPTIVGFVLTGVLIGPSGLNWITSLPAAQSISELGIIFLMFVLGLEISLDHLKRMSRPLITLGFAQVGGTILLATAFFAIALGFAGGKAFVLASCLALSSTAVILKLLQDKRETETPYGRVSVIILLFQDIAALPLMAAIPALALTVGPTPEGAQVAYALFWIFAFLAGCYLAGRFVIPRLFSEVTRTHSREVFFFSLISMTFVIAFLAEKAGLSMSLGAFVAGVLISESPYNKQALAELTPFRDIFLGFFFASLGMMVDLNFILSHLHHLVWLIPAMFVIKFSIVYAVVRYNSHSHGVSFASALTLTQIGEFSFVLAASALTHGIINQDEFQYFLSLAVTSLLLTPLLVSFGMRGSAHSSWPELARALGLAFWGSTPAKGGAEATPESTVTVVAPRRAIVIGLGHAGQRILAELHQYGVPCAGIDVNIENVQAVKRLGVEAIYGDATSPDVLHSAGIHEAFLVMITVSGKHITPRVMAVVRGLKPDAKIIVRVHYLLEMKELSGLSEDCLVVSESETANALIGKALACYGLADPALPTA